MKPRILIYSTAYYPLVGGAEVAVKEITDRLGHKYDFDLITARLNKNNPAIEEVGRVKVYRIGWGLKIDKIWLAFWGGFFGLRLHQKNSYQAVWAIMASYGGFGASVFKSRQRSVPFLLTLQEGDDLTEVEKKVQIIRDFWLDIFLRADYIQVISNHLASWARALGATATIEIVPNGVSVGRAVDHKIRLDDYKASGEKIIITTSRLVKKNGIDDLIRSLVYLPQGVRLLILGVGEEEQSLKKLATDLGLEQRIAWLGFVDNRQLFPYLEKADVFVRPSLSEGLGNSFLEAMAVGLPTVGTPVGGIVDFLKDGETGWLVKPHNAEDIARVVNYILNPTNEAEVAKIAKQGKELVYANYDWTKIAFAMDRIFSKLISNG